MILRINCNSSVNLKNLKEVSEIKSSILDYKLLNNQLNGNLLLSGKYISNIDMLVYEFNDLIPFSVMFNEVIDEIKNVSCEDFTYKHDDKNSEAIIVTFSLKVEYTNPIIKEEDEVQKQIDNTINEVLDKEIENRSYNEEFDIFNLNDSYKEIVINFK